MDTTNFFQILGRIDSIDPDNLAETKEIKADLLKSITFLEKLLHRLNRNERDALLEKLSGEQLAHLIKLFVLIERKIPRLCRMSASIVPRLIATNNLRISRLYPSLIDWIYLNKNVENDWLPFGEQKYGNLGSYANFLKFCDTEVVRLAKHDDRLARQQREAQAKKDSKRLSHLARQQEQRKRNTERASLNLVNAVAIGDWNAVCDLLAKGADPDFVRGPGIKTARQIAWLWGRDQMYFPTPTKPTVEMSREDHIERLKAWLSEYVLVVKQPLEVTLSEIEFDWENLSGSFSLACDRNVLRKRFDLHIDIAGRIVVTPPMFGSPLAFPASYPAVVLNQATETAVIEALETVFPRLRGYGFHRDAGLEISGYSRIEDRIIDRAKFEELITALRHKEFSITRRVINPPNGPS